MNMLHMVVAFHVVRKSMLAESPARLAESPASLRVPGSSSILERAEGVSAYAGTLTIKKSCLPEAGLFYWNFSNCSKIGQKKS